jgi:hypothetical protein
VIHALPRTVSSAWLENSKSACSPYEGLNGSPKASERPVEVQIRYSGENPNAAFFTVVG